MLIEELVAEDSAEFRTMFRMDKVSFDNLLYMIGPSIEKAETTMRQTISAKARLLVTLRLFVVLPMRVDLSPRLGGHVCPPTVERDRWPVEWPINPPLLSSSHSPSFSPPPERCKVSQQVWNRVMN